MGQYHYCVNLDKQQFIDPYPLGDLLKLHEQAGYHTGGVATALVVLLAACNGRGGGDFSASNDIEHIIGSWAGDRIAFVGDYGEPGDLPDGLDASEIFHACANGKWTDISMPLRAFMEQEFPWIEYATPYGVPDHVVRRERSEED